MGLRVAQATRLFRPATRLFRPATRRTEWFEPMGTVFSRRCSRQFRSAGRPDSESGAGRPRHPFSNTLSMLLSAQRGNSTFEMNDVELLREYVARGCQDSFSELVRRHINLVYGTATRQVRDPHSAQEISQKVFCALAQNARSIRNPAALAAWLYRTTCQLATLHVRSEHRRIERERVAAAVVTLKRMIEPGSILVQGRVLDEERGQPIDRFQILVAVGSTTFAPPKDGRNGAFSVPINVVSDEAKAAGIEIRAEGYEPARLTPALSSNQIPELTFKLRPASGWSGTVLLPNGEPAVDTEVGMSTFARTLILGDRKFLFREQSIIRRTDASGRFRLDPLPSERPSGRVIVAVHSQGYAEHDADRFASGLSLQLLPWGRIEGVLRSRGEPLANEKLYVMKRHWNPWTIGITYWRSAEGLEAWREQRSYGVKFEADGTFRADDVPPGEYTLRVMLNEVRAVNEMRPIGMPLSGSVGVPARRARRTTRLWPAALCESPPPPRGRHRARRSGPPFAPC